MAISPDHRILQSACRTACTYFEQFSLRIAHNLELPGGRCSARFGSSPSQLGPMNAKTAFDLIFRNARIRTAPTTVDIGVSGGRIAAIAPRLAYEGAEIEVGGKLALPGFVDTH